MWGLLTTKGILYRGCRGYIYIYIGVYRDIYGLGFKGWGFPKFRDTSVGWGPPEKVQSISRSIFRVFWYVLFGGMRWGLRRLGTSVSTCAKVPPS